MNSKEYSLTKIVATLGPSSDDEATIRAMIEAGLSVARINCSHGDWETRANRIEMIRRLSKEYQRPIGILVDLQGPKIRTGTLPDGGVELTTGQKVILSPLEEHADYTSDIKVIHIRNYMELPSEVEVGQRILLDDGLLRLKVVNIQGNKVECSVSYGGTLKSNKGVNLPESAQLGVEVITPKDRKDLIEAVKLNADFIALSFVRHSKDIVELKQLIQDAKPKSPIKTIAKIEKPQAMEHLSAILKEVDGVMVARGDLGVELDPEKVPMLQKKIIAEANLNEKFVITATQMMDSMIKNPFPTRAEVSDVANAILDGTDAVMLSGETAAGAHPVLAVDYMRKIALEVESKTSIPVVQKDVHMLEGIPEAELNGIAIAQGVKTFSTMKNIKAIVSFSCSGKSVQRISKLKPNTQIIAATTYQHTYNYLSIVWGVTPIYFNQVHRTTNTLINIEEEIIRLGLIKLNDTVIITGGIPLAARSAANFVKLHKCDGSMKEQVKIQEESFKEDLGPALVTK
jgi:pyruvate kinase